MVDKLNANPYYYRISGLNVASEIPLPMRLPLQSTGDLKVDVTFCLGDVPKQLDHSTHRGANWMANKNQFLLDLPHIGRFLAYDGCRLIICPASGIAVDDILVFATGTALAGILYQRGAWLLHGSAVLDSGRAFMFCGPSGAGKSTLAGALSRNGCDFLADDVCSVEQSESGHTLIQPDGRVLRLYNDSIAQIGLAEAVGSRVRQRIEKFHVIPPGKATSGLEPAPLAAIYILADANTAFPSAITLLSPLTAAQALLHQTYRRQLALAYCNQGNLVARTAALLSEIPVFLFHRPHDFVHLNETLARLRAHWDELL
ncbi:hypothetical protein [Ferrovibrio sp.]|uniref:hypothetical protein n=1 Tax=Ferrovibrio sp. TaxID=1917215 RepID=UPI001B50C91C|nr:hypothetical protein [Ferrovibrio sp.]MBP7064093.1 hypothetical protein [Ferrovibrio sp.]